MFCGKELGTKKISLPAVLMSCRVFEGFVVDWVLLVWISDVAVPIDLSWVAGGRRSWFFRWQLESQRTGQTMSNRNGRVVKWVPWDHLKSSMKIVVAIMAVLVNIFCSSTNVLSQYFSNLWIHLLTKRELILSYENYKKVNWSMAYLFKE